MTRADLTRKIHQVHGGLTLRHSKAVLGYVLDLLQEGLVKEGHAVLSGFGTFRVVQRRERKGWDMGRKIPVTVPPRKEVVFIPSRRARSTKSSGRRETRK